MMPDPPVVAATARLDELAALAARTQERGYLVLDESGLLVGDVTRAALTEAQALWTDWEGHTVDEIYTPEVVTVYPDESVSVALQRMGIFDRYQLPVVERGAPERPMGLVRQGDIGAAYQQALAHRSRQRVGERRRQLEVQAPDQIVDLVVPPDSPVAGRPIRAIAWPEGCLIVAVRRGDDVLLGQGGVVIRPGDRITAYARAESAPALRELVAGEVL
jgi:hypothetical protein